MSRALALILAVVVARLLVPVLGLPWNFAPLMVLAFCGGLYLPRRTALWLPVVALVVSDLILNVYNQRPLFTGYTLVAGFAYLAATSLGLLLASRKSWLSLAAGSIACSLLFYLVSNTWSWMSEPEYAALHIGWFQAMTTGLPGYPPTWMFFRNSVVSDLLFTAVFVLAMEGRNILALAPLPRAA